MDTSAKNSLPRTWHHSKLKNIVHKRIRFVAVVLSSFINIACLCAETLEVESFTPNPFDLSASTTKKKNDLAGNPCALIKVIIPNEIKSISFEGNFICSDNDGSEISAYFTDGTKKIIIKSPGYEPLSITFSDFGVFRLISKTVYNLSLRVNRNSHNSNAPEQASITSIHDILDNSQGDPIDEMVSKANLLYSKGNVIDAIPLLEKAAKLGHPEALLSLGLLYEQGVVINDSTILKTNARTAFINVQNSAQQGYVPAQRVLSRYYKTGTGAEVDNEKADLWQHIYEMNTKPDNSPDDQIFYSVEQQAEYPGGNNQLLRDLNNAIMYPAKAVENDISGRVTIRFVIEKDGSIGDIKILNTLCFTYKKDSNGGYSKKNITDAAIAESFEKAAINAIRQLKPFYPAKNNGIPVKVWFTLPINFKVQD